MPRASIRAAASSDDRRWRRRLLIATWPTLLLLAASRWNRSAAELTEAGKVLDRIRPTVAANTTDDLYDHLQPDDPVKICGITAILGDYERTVKEPLQPLSPSSPLFVATDQEQILDGGNGTTAWTRIRVNSSLWRDDCARPDFARARNHPCSQPFLFNIAKFYKMQFYRVPEIRAAGCNVVVWLDGTIQIRDPTFMGRMADRAARGQNYVVYVSDGRPSKRMGLRDGLVSSEAGRSMTGKYGGKKRGFGPRQEVDRQYQYYLDEGFREKWFVNETWFDEYKGVESNVGKYGVYVTCMVMFDLRKRETREFLDCWWAENVLRSTQDQVSFPYCAWKHRARVWALPDAEDPGKWPDGWVANNRNFFKREHGT